MADTLPLPRRSANGAILRERILLFGDAGVGKTHQYFTVALWHQNLGSDARFYGINTDGSWEWVADNDDFRGLTNIEWVDVETYQDAIDAVKRINGKVRRGLDWLCSDLHDQLWEWDKDEYAQGQAKAKGKSIDDLGDLWKTEGPGGGYPIEGWEWGMPNARWRVLTNNLLLRTPAHLMLISGEKPLQDESSKGDNEFQKKQRDTFKHVGALPAGQKHDPFTYRSILNIQSMGERKQGIITAKETSGNRRMMGKPIGKAKVLRPEPIEDFFVDYLVGVGGWQMS